MFDSVNVFENVFDSVNVFENVFDSVNVLNSVKVFDSVNVFKNVFDPVIVNVEIGRHPSIAISLDTEKIPNVSQQYVCQNRCCWNIYKTIST